MEKMSYAYSRFNLYRTVIKSFNNHVDVDVKNVILKDAEKYIEIMESYQDSLDTTKVTNYWRKFLSPVIMNVLTSLKVLP